MVEFICYSLIKFLNQLPTDIGKHTVRDERSIYIILEYHMLTFIFRFTELAHLRNHIIMLRAFGALQLHRCEDLCSLIVQAQFYTLEDIGSGKESIYYFIVILVLFQHRLEFDKERNTAFGCLASKNLFESLVVVAIQSHTRSEVFRHAEREKAVALHLVDTEALQLSLIIDETESVAIGKTCNSSHIE